MEQIEGRGGRGIQSVHSEIENWINISKEIGQYELWFASCTIQLGKYRKVCLPGPAPARFEITTPWPIFCIYSLLVNRDYTV